MIKLAKLVLFLGTMMLYARCDNTTTISLPLTRRKVYPEPGDFDPETLEIISEDSEGGRRLQEIEKDVTNVNNLQYFATLYIGANKKEMTFIYDTGSTHLWVPMANCSSCPNNKYTATSTFVDTNSRDTIQYGSGRVEGSIAVDDVAITRDQPSIRSSKLTIFGIANFNRNSCSRSSR